MQTKRMLAAALLFLLKLLAAILIVLAIYRFGVFAYRFGHSIFDGAAMSSPPGKDVVVVLPEGCALGQVAELLKAKGLIRDPWVFRVQVRLSPYGGAFLAGSYVLNTSMNAQEIIAALCGHAQGET